MEGEQIMEVGGSSELFSTREWKEPDSLLLANYLPPAEGTAVTIVDENGHIFDLVPRSNLELEAGTPDSSELDILSADEELQILMVGLNGAGKTTVLETIRNLGLGGTIKTTSTLGFTVKTLKCNNNTSFIVWDLEGDDKIRASWRQYYHNIEGIIFVLDGNDLSRVDEARNELHKILNEDELKDVPLCVFLNTYDDLSLILGCEVGQKLGLSSLDQPKWGIRTISGFDQVGVYAGLSWLSRNIGTKEYIW